MTSRESTADNRGRILNFLTLFASSGTLICCAIPATMVALGFGATLAGLVSEFPQLVWLSEKKLWIFGGGAILLALGGLLQWRARTLPCPADKRLAEACAVTRRSSMRLYFVSLFIYLFGFLVSFVFPHFIV